MKETFYFPHDNNAHTDPRLMSVFMECWLAWIWLFWIIIELLHQQEDGKITKEQFDNYVKWYAGKETWTRVEQLLDTYLTNDLLCLTDDEMIYSNRVLQNKKFRDDLSAKRSIAWKKSAKSRAKNKGDSTSVEQNLTSVEQGKERKGKERKINNKLNIISKEITKETFWQDSINNMQAIIKKAVEDNGMIYKPWYQERSRIKNIVTWKEFWKVCEKCNMDRETFVINIINLASKLPYCKSIWNWTDLYYNYAEVYNKWSKEKLKLKAKEKEILDIPAEDIF